MPKNESKLVNEVRKSLIANGALAWKLSGGEMGAGLPDLVVGYRGKVAAIEAKRGPSIDEKRSADSVVDLLSDLQKVRLREAIRAGWYAGMLVFDKETEREASLVRLGLLNDRVCAYSRYSASFPATIGVLDVIRVPYLGKEVWEVTNFLWAVDGEPPR